MAKSLRSHKRTSRIGWFTESQRNRIEKNQLSKDDRSDLLIKRGGFLNKQLIAEINDLCLIIKNDKLGDWLNSYKVRLEFERLEGKLDQILGFYSVLPNRLAVTSKGGVRQFFLKRIEHEKATDSEIKTESYRRKQMTNGLKSHEKNLVFKYVEKIGYNFPLQEGHFYSWKEVKQLLTKKMDEKPKLITTKEKEALRKKMELAWKMLFEKIDEKSKNEIISKTGFWIRLQPYSHFIA